LSPHRRPYLLCCHRTRFGTHCLKVQLIIFPNLIFQHVDSGLEEIEKKKRVNYEESTEKLFVT
jgi:hypothetical protein